MPDSLPDLAGAPAAHPADLWSGSVRADVAARLARPDLGRWLAQAQQVRGCTRPVRLVGGSARINPVTGEVLGEYASAGEPDGITYVRCGNRRRSVCPSCSHEYQGDVWHLIMAGAAGGKQVPETVAAHPLVFATLTAPSFGAVHSSRKPGTPGSRRCRPRRSASAGVCPHGKPRWCMATHEPGDPQLGQPLCAECYDYPGQAVWQWWAPELWRRFAITLRRHLARHLGVTETACRRVLRVQFAKVAEYQRRGLIHFHALIRLDGPATDVDAYPAPAVTVDPTTLAQLVRSSAAAVSCTADPVDADDTARLLRFGAQVDARPVHQLADRGDAGGGELHPEIVAAYIAKYATKAAADLTTVEVTNPHLDRLRVTVRTLAWRAEVAGLCGEDGPYKGWRRWVSMLGFRGHFATKSRRYSTTLGRLRQARRDHAIRTRRPAALAESVGVVEDQDQADETLVVGSWRFAGMGWLTDGDAALAAASAARARDH